MEQLKIQEPDQPSPTFWSWIKLILHKTEAKLAFKMGLAASISLVLGLAFAGFFDRPDTLVSGLWSVMASIVVLQAFLGGTYKAAWARFLGVVIGSTAGAILVNALGADAVSLGISVFITIIFCALLGVKDSFRIAGLSTAVIIIMGGLHPLINPWLFSLYRFIDSCIGIAVGVAVARFVWPQTAIGNIRKNIGKTLDLLSKLYRIAVNVEEESSADKAVATKLLSEIETLLLDNRNNKKEADLELYDNPSAKGNWSVIIDQVETIYEAVSSLNTIHKDTLAKIFDDPLAAAVADLVDKTDQEFFVLEKFMLNETPPSSTDELRKSLTHLSDELERFRGTRTTRKFNLEDVECYFVYFYSLRTIGEAIIKMDEQVRSIDTD